MIADGAEGVILRSPASLYLQTRSPLLIKLKAARGDKEALVMEVEQDKSLLIKLPDGALMTVEPDNVKFSTQPKRGDIVSFSFEKYSKTSLPISPKIYRIRTDITWEDVLRNESTEAQLNEASLRAIGSTAPQGKPLGYWTSEKGKNMRQLFVHIAAKLRFDPLIPTNWYNITTQELRKFKGVNTVLHRFSGSLVGTLKYLFPDIGLEESKFLFMTKSYWASSKNRRAVLENFAKTHGFDALVAENWYNVPSESILNFKGGQALKSFYNGSMANAIIHLFPEVNMKREHFSYLGQRYWTDLKNRRKLFEDFAKWKGFDPLIPKFWYSQHASGILAFKGAASMISNYSGNFRDALIELFPDVKLDPFKFLFLSRSQGKTALNTRKRRIALEHLVRSRGKDPLNPEVWYSINPNTIKSSKANLVLDFYAGSLPKALLSLFPEIGLDPSRIPNFSAPEYTPSSRQLFENFARQKGFDPLLPSAWYSISVSTILSSEIQVALTEYGYSLVKALFILFPDIGLNENQFPAAIRNSWIHVKNRQRFVALAARHNFDPLIPKNWYLVSKAEILKPTMSSVATYYGGSITNALLTLFPDIGLEKGSLIKSM